MADLTDEILDDFVRHAVGSSREVDARPLLADRVELLVAEVRRLRGSIGDVRDAVLDHEYGTAVERADDALAGK